MNHHFFFATLQMNPTKVTTSVPIIPVKIQEIVTEFVLFNSDCKTVIAPSAKTMLKIKVAPKLTKNRLSLHYRGFHNICAKIYGFQLFY